MLFSRSIQEAGMQELSRKKAIAASMAFVNGCSVPTEIWGQIFEEIIQDFFNEDSSNKYINIGDYWLFHTRKGKGVSGLRGLLAFEHVISRDRKLYRHFFSLRIQMSNVLVSSDDIDNNMFENPKGMHDLSRLFRNSLRVVTISLRSTTHERRYYRNILNHMRDLAELLTRGFFSVRNIDHLTIELDDNLSMLYFEKDLFQVASQFLLGGVQRLIMRSPPKSLNIMSFLSRNEEDYFIASMRSISTKDTPPPSYEVGITSGLPRVDLDEFLGVKCDIIYVRRPIDEDYSIFGLLWVANGGKRLPYGEK